MSAACVTEISAASPNSFEEAINKGLDRANNALDGIERAWMKEMKVVVKGGRVEEYRICLQLTSVDSCQNPAARIVNKCHSHGLAPVTEI